MILNHKLDIHRVVLCLIALASISLSTSLMTTTTNASISPLGGSNQNSNITIVESEGIVPVDIHTEPSVLRVGDRFSINAEIFNYSPHFATIPDSGCSPTGLSATFDSHVDVSSGVQFVTCHQDILAPAGLMASVAGWPSENYTATSPGITNATLHLVYGITNDNNSTEYRQYDTEYLFTILPARQPGAGA